MCENSDADKCTDSPFSDGTQQVHKFEPTDHSVMAHNKLTSYVNKKITPKDKRKTYQYSATLNALLELSNVCRQKITNTGYLGHVVEL